MRRIAHLLVAMAAAAGLAVLPSGSANAFGGEWLGCRILPGSSTYTNGYCETSQPAGSYSVSFAVQNGSGTYSYAWTLHGQYSSPVGCTSTSYYCDVTVTAAGANRAIDATVTISQGGQNLTLSAEAYIEAICRIGGRYEFC